MTAVQELATSQDIQQNVIFPPGDLYSDEPPVETELHLRQIILLLQCVDGEYQPLEPNSQGHLFSQQLDLYLGIHENKLRLFTTEGELLPTPEEVAQRETQRAEQETQRAEQEAQRADRLAAKLRELNIDPDTI